MAVIPAYWYVERFEGGSAFEIDPALVLWDGPEPIAERASLFDAATGEIHGEAVLMGALPWPRFRDLFIGEKVILPFGMAETLERLQDELLAFAPEYDGSHSMDKGSELRFTCWVQVQGIKVLAFHVNSYLELDYRRANAARGP